MPEQIMNKPRLTPEEIQAREVADIAVHRVFKSLGVDPENPESLEELRADIRFGRKMRKIADHGVMAFIGVMATAMAAVIWAGIMSKMKGE